MTIECYTKACPYHTCHTDPEDGPFCYEDNCRFVSGAEVFAEIRESILFGYLCGGPTKDGYWLIAASDGDGYLVHNSIITLRKP
jgi:hypothetical protein